MLVMVIRLSPRLIEYSETLHHQLKNYLKLTGARLMTKLATKYVPVGENAVVMGGNPHQPVFSLYLPYVTRFK